MSEHVTEKVIRARLSDGQLRFGDNSIRHLLSIIDELRGELEMWKANADEAALKAARREAEVAELKDNFKSFQQEAWKILREESDEEEKETDLFGELAHSNAFEELKRRDEERQAIKSYVKNSKSDWILPMTVFCMAVVRNETVDVRFGHTAAALQAEWRRMADKIAELEKEVKACRKGEQE